MKEHESDFFVLTVKSPEGDVSALFDRDDEELIRAYQWRAYRYGTAFYLRFNIARETFMAHRIVMGCVKGDGLIVDHINCDTLDNRKSNLRFVTRRENSLNKRATAKSGFRGVHLCRDKFAVKLRKHGVLHYGGIFLTKEEAALRANEMMIDLYGSIAMLNKVEA